MLNFLLNIELDSKEKIYTLLLSLVAFSLPWGVEFYNGAVLLLFIFLIYSSAKIGIIEFPKQKPFYSYALFVLLLSTSLLYSDNLSKGVGVVLNFAHLLFWGLILLSNRFKFALKPIVVSFIISCLALALKSNVEVIVHIVSNDEELSKLFTFYHRNFLSNIATSLPQPIYFSLYLIGSWLMYFYTLRRTKIYHHILFALFTLYVLFFLYILSSKVAILFIGFYLGMIFISYVFKRLNIKYNILFSLLILSTLCFSFYVFRLEISRILFGDGESVMWHQDLIGRLRYFLETGDPARSENWNAAMELIKQNLIFGVGAGDSLMELQKVRDSLSWAYIETANTHNQFLGISVCGGLISLLSFLVFIIMFFRESILSKNTVLTYIIILSIVFMFVENIFARHAGIIFFGFFFFLLYRHNQFRRIA